MRPNFVYGAICTSALVPMRSAPRSDAVQVLCMLGHASNDAHGQVYDQLDRLPQKHAALDDMGRLSSPGDRRPAGARAGRSDDPGDGPRPNLASLWRARQ